MCGALLSSAQCYVPRVHVVRPSSGVCIPPVVGMHTVIVNEAYFLSYSSGLNKL